MQRVSGQLKHDRTGIEVKSGQSNAAARQPIVPIVLTGRIAAHTQTNADKRTPRRTTKRTTKRVAEQVYTCITSRGRFAL